MKHIVIGWEVTISIDNLHMIGVRVAVGSPSLPAEVPDTQRASFSRDAVPRDTDTQS